MAEITEDDVEQERRYYERIDACVEACADAEIENSLPEHAVYLMRKMFQKGKKH